MVHPEVTLEWVTPVLKACGVTRLANVTGLDRIGIPVVMAVRPESKSVSVHQGKGLTLEAAKASGAMEALESWHAQNITLPEIKTSYADLSLDNPVMSLAWLPTGNEPDLDQSQIVTWLQGFDICSGNPVWVPKQVVHTDFVQPVEIDWLGTTSNGLAAGNGLAEALCAALYELIERDCIALWRGQRLSQRVRRRVRTESIDDRHIRLLLEKFNQAKINYQIYDITSDIPVPAYLCTIFEGYDGDGSSSRASSGYGCHLDPSVALSRALTEASQSRLTRIAGSRDDLGSRDYRVSPRLHEQLAILDLHFAAGSGVAFRHDSDESSDTFEGDLDHICGKLRAAGLPEIIGIDLTRAEFGVPVVRAVVPGLGRRSRRAGYVPGRRPLNAVALAGSVP